MVKLKIAPRLMLLFLVVSLVPLALINYYWFRLNQSTLRNNATSRQTLLTTTAANKVNQFITDKVNLLIIHSQTSSVQSFDLPYANQDFQTLITQDKDLQSVTLVDNAGAEKLSVYSNGSKRALKNVLATDAFRAATFLSGKEYISPVMFSESGQPFVEIAVPLVKYDSSQILSNLSTAESGLIRDQNAIKGILLARVDLANLWQSVLSARLGTNGYAYLVDSHGQLIAYPDSLFLTSHRDLSKNGEVAAFLRDPYNAGPAMVVESEKGIRVLSTYQPVPRTNWAVIAEEPVQSIFGGANRMAKLGIVVFGVVGLVVLVMSYIFSRRLTKPIKELVHGAALISQGHLQTQIVVHSSDEIGALGKSFNDMAASLSKLVRRATSESNKLNVILNNATEGVIAVNQDRQVVVANTAAVALKERSIKNIVGLTLEDAFDWLQDGRPFAPALDQSKVYMGVSVIGPNQRMHFLEVLVSLIANDPNGIKAIITIIDKTEGRELENMKVDFVSMAAHELRTPMTAIKGYIDLIAHDDESKLSEQTKTFLTRVQFSTAQLVGLINNLLNVAKIERGALSMNFEKLNWTQLVQDAVEDQKLSAKLKNITLNYESINDDLYILADHIAIAEVLNNFITNAIKYTLDNGNVTVSIKREKGQIVTTVADNGIGIPPNAIEYLFTKFYRVNGGLASGSGGTGLGLYISKAIVELHHGTVSVLSTEGQGSTFSFSLAPFDQANYDKIVQNGPTKVNNRHGWITKNITR